MCADTETQGESPASVTAARNRVAQSAPPRAQPRPLPLGHGLPTPPAQEAGSKPALQLPRPPAGHHPLGDPVTLPLWACDPPVGAAGGRAGGAAPAGKPSLPSWTQRALACAWGGGRAHGQQSHPGLPPVPVPGLGFTGRQWSSPSAQSHAGGTVRRHPRRGRGSADLQTLRGEPPTQDRKKDVRLTQ